MPGDALATVWRRTFRFAAVVPAADCDDDPPAAVVDATERMTSAVTTPPRTLSPSTSDVLVWRAPSALVTCDADVVRSTTALATLVSPTTPRMSRSRNSSSSAALPGPVCEPAACEMLTLTSGMLSSGT